MLTTPLILCFEEDHAEASVIAQAAHMRVALIARHRFPDGELKLRLPDTLPARTVLFRSLHIPNEKLVEVLLVAGSARGLGAEHLTLVAPYLAYMRQDMAFHPDEAVSQRIVGPFLAGLFDAVVTGPTLTNVNDFRAIWIDAPSTESPCAEPATPRSSPR